MSRFVRSVRISAPVEKVYEFHLHPANLLLIAPPSSKMRLVAITDEIMRPGTRVTVRSIQAGIPVELEAEIVELDPPHLLRDRQVKGPFGRWTHTHRFETISEGTLLTDEIDYELPLGPLGGLVMGRVIRQDLDSTFSYRQEATRKLLEGGVEAEEMLSQRCVAGTPATDPSPR